jgi:NitT/TauT family transport system substrate-binding protein
MVGVSREWLMAVMVVASLGLSACGAGSAPPAAPKQAAPAAQPTAAPAQAPAAAPSKPSAPAATAYSPTPLQPPVEITMGVLGISAEGGSYIAEEKGYFKQEGLEVTITTIANILDVVPALSSGQMDVAQGGLNAGIFNAATRDVPVRIVADSGSNGSPQDDPASLMLRKDLADTGQIKDYADMKGLRVATSAKDNIAEVWVAKALQKAGLTLQDVDYQGNLAFTNMAAAFGNKAIDMAIVPEPFATAFEGQGLAARWKGTYEIYGTNEQVGVVMYGAKMIANPDLARRWMTAYLRGVRDYNDAFLSPARKGRDEVIGIMIKNTPLKDPNLWERIKVPTLHTDGALDVKAMQQDADYYHSTGAVPTPVDASRIVDDSFRTYANQQLGPYQP